MPAKRARSEERDAGIKDGDKKYYLLKSEPDEFSIDDLHKDKDSVWEGVRNYQARNILKSMSVGDQAFFYHSSCGKAAGIYGVCEVTRAAYPCPFALDKASKYFDPKATADTNNWVCVDVKLVYKFKAPVLLSALKDIKAKANAASTPLADLVLLKSSRLSVQPVTDAEWTHISSLL